MSEFTLQIILFLAWGLYPLFMQAQSEPVSMETIQLSNTEVAIYANNSAPCPVSINIEFELENLTPVEKVPDVIVIPALAKDFEMVSLEAVKQGKSMGYNYSYSYQYGDAVNTSHDDDYSYGLPYAKGETYTMSQGNNGPFSHRGKNAVDFTMPEGTEIRAARDGIVIRVKEDSDSGCRFPKCVNMANQVLIFHEDGTIADYSHMKKGGALVKIGEKVERGQVLGRSGNTGWSSGPHLHLEVYYYEGERKITVPLSFDVSTDQSAILEIGKYTAFE